MRSVMIPTVLFAGALAMVSPIQAGPNDGRSEEAGLQQVKPLLTVENEKIDLGEVKAGSEAVATFVFHNKGDVDVKILRAKPS